MNHTLTPPGGFAIPPAETPQPPFQYFATLKVKNFFLMEAPVFQFVPIAPCLSLSTTEKSLARSSQPLPFGDISKY